MTSTILEEEARVNKNIEDIQEKVNTSRQDLDKANDKMEIFYKKLLDEN